MMKLNWGIHDVVLWVWLLVFVVIAGWVCVWLDIYFVSLGYYRKKVAPAIECQLSLLEFAGERSELMASLNADSCEILQLVAWIIR